MIRHKQGCINFLKQPGEMRFNRPLVAREPKRKSEGLRVFWLLKKPSTFGLLPKVCKHRH